MRSPDLYVSAMGSSILNTQGAQQSTSGAHVWPWACQPVPADLLIALGSLAEVRSALMNSIFHKVKCGDGGIRDIEVAKQVLILQHRSVWPC